jgi:hypothetical protein
MAPKYRWQDLEGRVTINKIIKEKISYWHDGLHEWQLGLVAPLEALLKRSEHLEDPLYCYEKVVSKMVIPQRYPA